jgi:hypothetical protein
MIPVQQILGLAKAAADAFHMFHLARHVAEAGVHGAKYVAEKMNEPSKEPEKKTKK